MGRYRLDGIMDDLIEDARQFAECSTTWTSFEPIHQRVICKIHNPVWRYERFYKTTQWTMLQIAFDAMDADLDVHRRHDRRYRRH